MENPGILEQVTEEAALELKHKTSDFVRSIVAELVGPMGAISQPEARTGPYRSRAARNKAVYRNVLSI